MKRGEVLVFLFGWGILNNKDLCNIDDLFLYFPIFLHTIGLNSFIQGLSSNQNIRLMMVVLNLSFFSSFSRLRYLPENLCKTAKLINELLCENFSAGWRQGRSNSSINATPKGLGAWTEFLESCDCTQKYKYLKGFSASFFFCFTSLSERSILQLRLLLAYKVY